MAGLTSTLSKTEQRLCKMWASAEMTGDFFDLNQRLFDVAVFMGFEGVEDDTVSTFAFLATLALNRAVYSIKDRERVAA